VVTVGFTVHTGAEGFWARRARTSIDVLGPGVLVGRVVGLGCLQEQAAEEERKRRFKRRETASERGIPPVMQFVK
jgi:hypothetical protein